MHSETTVSRIFIWLLSTLLLLVILSVAVPDQLFARWGLRKVDYLGAILREHTPSDSLVAAKQSQKIVCKTLDTHLPADSCGTAYTCLEDYSEGQAYTRHLFEALYAAKHCDSLCRIAFYGDSFIEGDILTADIRDSLQQVFGGRGVGFLPMASEVSRYRKSLSSESEGWQVHSCLKSQKDTTLGMSGYAFRADKQAVLTLYPVQPLPAVRVLYTQADSSEVTVTAGAATQTATLPRAAGVRSIPLPLAQTDSKTLELAFSASPGAVFYGLDIRADTGVYVDNFSLRGNSGLGIDRISDTQFQQFNTLMHYKLIVLQFGLNVASPEAKGFTQYEKNMTTLIERLKRQFPDAAILMLSTSDRSQKKNGTYQTIPSIPVLVESQKRVASQTHILFWNLYEAMGGKNSMIALVKARPAQANKDYTHLTFAGGKRIGQTFVKALLYQYRQYEITSFATTTKR